MFAVLVLLYRRFMAPFVNMGSLLLAPLGGLIALHIAGQPVSMPVLIGILMLFGIVAKNSILLVDFAVEVMDKGVPKNEAIMRRRPQARPADRDDHGGDGRRHGPDRPRRSRATPAGARRWASSVIGGLILSTVLTLVLVPACFSLADRHREAARAAVRQRCSTIEPGHSEPGDSGARSRRSDIGSAAG